MREPTQVELDQLLQVYLRNYAERFGNPTQFEESAATKVIAKALKVVWDNAETVDPLGGISSYSGKLLVVVWPDGLSFLDTFIFKDGRMIVTELEPILMRED